MMEDSFFEYRNHAAAGSDSDNEIIDSSFSQSFVPKTPAKKNQTVYVPESDDSTGDESEKENASKNISKSLARRNSVKLHHVVLSSDDDKSSRGSFQRQSESSNKEVIISSDDEVDQQVSPEIIPKRRPLVKPSPRSSDSFIGRKKKKHMILLDSESDNSFIKEHARKKKCLKDTPVKIDSVQKNIIRNIQNMSIQNDSIVSENDNEQSDQDGSQNSDENGESDDETVSQEHNSGENGESDDETESQESENEVSDSDHKNDDKSHKSCNKNKQDDKNKDPRHLKQSDLSDENYTSSNEVSDSDNQDYKNKHNDKKHSDQSNAMEPSINEDNVTEKNDVETSRNKLSNDLNENADETSSSGKKDSVASDDGLEEERMMMSRATRMSIMGVIPKENDSDDSDYIESDDTAQSSRASSTGNIYMGPDIEAQTPEIPAKADDGDISRITCSPITSPSHNLTNEINDSIHENDEINSSLNKNNAKGTYINLYSPEVVDLKNKVLKKVNKETKVYKENVIDDDVTIIDKEPEIIALSSDDEVEVKDDKLPNIKKSPSVKKSPRSKDEGTELNNDIKKYLAPPSYPNQGIVYVKKHVRENELSKLNGLREDLQNVRYLMENMDVETLPDRGAKLIERLDALERDVQKQGNKVANMVVEPDMPTQEQMSRDGFAPGDKGLSWDDIQKASNAVQPRMFGKQAMATHMAERSLILDRLRDLYESLASRPPEESQAKQPASVKSELMEHQLHALAWLKWRETQKPSGGILADDMGLGKTITMISLIAADKEGSIDNDENDDDDRGPRSARGGTLVVCPATLVQQWANEVGKHCKSHAISVCLHHGSARATQPHRLAANDLVITTYNIMQRESVSGVLSRIRWRRVILDEAHVVRNYKSATSQGVCSLHGRRRWALTGTPLHNKDLDLFALLKFLRCTPFDDLTMWKKWIDNKSQGGSERLNTIMSCVMLRRTKLQLQEKGQLKCLPERSAHEVSVTLQQEEMNVYQKVLVFSKTLFAQFLHQRAERAAGTQGLMPPKKDSEYAKMHKRMIALQGAKPVKSHEILVLLLRLRQVCCHCGLIAAMLDHDNNAELAEDAGSEDLLAELNKLTLEDNNSSRRRSGGKRDEEEEEQAGEGTTAAEAIKSVLSSNNPVFNLQRQSSKIKAVMECLDKNVFKNKGEKAVVVSQWTSVLSLVERELKAARIHSVTLSGEVPVSARAPLINALNDPKSDVRVMLLSLCAGGVGLNLCGANHLLLLDPHWNPQLEEQAQDRIYRVGQRKPVHIYKFMCVDTVEQSIRQLQKAKLELAENVLTGAKNTNGKLSVEELKILFNMGPQDGS